MARFTGSQHEITISPEVVHTVQQLQMALRARTSLQAKAALSRPQLHAIDRLLQSVSADGGAHVSAQTASQVRSALVSVVDHVQSPNFRYTEGNMLLALVPSIANAIRLPVSMGGLPQLPVIARNNAANVMSLRDLEKEFREVSQRLARLDESIRNLKETDSSDDFAVADANEFASLKKRAMQLSDKIKRMKTQEAASKSFSAGTSPFAALASRRAGVVKSEEDAAWDAHRGPRDNASVDEALIADLLGTIAHIRAQLQALESSIEQHQHGALLGPTRRLMLTDAGSSRTAALAKARGVRAAKKAPRDNGDDLNGDELMLAAYLHEATSRILPFLAAKINREGDVSIFKGIPLIDSREKALTAFHALYGRTGKPIRLAQGDAPEMKYVRVFEELLNLASDAAMALVERDVAKVRPLMEDLKVQASYVQRHFNFV